MPIIMVACIIVFLVALILALSLNEDWLVIVALGALLLPLWIAAFAGGARRDPQVKRRFPPSPRAALLGGLIPGVVATIWGFFLIAREELAIGIPLAVLVGPMLLLVWWGYR
jgi:hypothetical protein